MSGEVAGFTPEHEVHGSKRSRMHCTIVCVTLFTLMGLAILVALIITYASDPPGLVVYPEEVVIVEGQIGNKSARQHYEDIMNNLVATRGNSRDKDGAQNLHDCSFSNRYDGECIFELRWATDHCLEDDDWGYRRQDPCFILAFNQPKDWVPQAYTSLAELPEEMPESLRQHIENAFINRQSLEMLWVSCSGASSADTEFMGEVTLMPWQGFPAYYFPQRGDTHPSAIPYLSLKLHGTEGGALIGIKCYFWANNLETPHLAASIELLV